MTATLILFLLAGAAFVGLLAALVQTVRRDGLGHRPPPASHHHWDELAPTPPD